MKNTASARTEQLERSVKALAALVMLIGSLIIEIWEGFRTNTLPWAKCNFFATMFGGAIILNWDFPLWEALQIEKWRPLNSPNYQIYGILMVLAPYLGWGLMKVCVKRRLVRRLLDTMTISDLKNRLGQYPRFVSDKPIDNYTRKLRLAKAGLPLEKFRLAVPTIESSLQIYIDEVKEERSAGTVDILYSHTEIPTKTDLIEISRIPQNTVIVGKTRADNLSVDLREVPHLLIAGQTGGGKSTFLRQLVTSLYLRNKAYEFSLIDLKEGLEFQLFESLDRVEVISTAESAVFALSQIATELKGRMNLLKAAKCKDIDSYIKKIKEECEELGTETKPQTMSRKIVVIDEVAELFLAGGAASAQDSQTAKEIVGKISRLGRAVGLHLVLGTQRPDARALDTQIKANMPGKLCFQMPDIASSMVVLGTARARELPGIAGRAVWQQGMRMIEVQTPLLSPQESDKLLAPHRSEPGHSDGTTGSAVRKAVSSKVSNGSSGEQREGDW